MSKPKIETSISERRPLVQQNLIYRVRIYSAGNLEQASPRPPASSTVIFKQLGEPNNYPVSGRKGYSLVTEYNYLLIPTQPGAVHLPPIQVEGKYSSGQGFSTQSEQGTVLYVQPRPEGTTNWLPLYDLRLQTKLPDLRRIKAGEPLILRVTLSAVGATGAQLPSIVEQLNSPDFNVYAGPSETQGQISNDGLDLIGSRSEEFTLVPKHGGRLTLPALAVPWWDLRTNQTSVASTIPRTILVQGPANPSREQDEGFFNLPEGTRLWFWVPMIMMLALVLASWLLVLLGSGRNPATHWIARSSRQLLGDLYRPAARVMSSISPRRHFHRFRTWLGRQLPISWKLWYCLRAVDQETDPHTWGHALQILASKHLGVRPHADLQHLGQSIVACHPNADPHAVARLMAELDQAIYGGQPLASFKQWRKEFKKQIKPRLFPIRFRHCGASPRRHELPTLNPSIRGS